MSSPPVLVLFGSHQGMADKIRQRDEENLVEHIRLKHKIRVHPRNFVRNSNQVIGKFKELYDGEEKFVYYVGHGNKDGDLCFDDGNFSLQNFPPPPPLFPPLPPPLFPPLPPPLFPPLPPPLFPPLPPLFPPMQPDFKIHVRLFMPHHEKARDAFQSFQESNRVFLERTAFTCIDRGLDDLYDELQKLRQQNN